MKLINADKYKKDIEHYRNTICYQRNVTMDDCMRILDKQEDVLDKIHSDIFKLHPLSTEGECLINAVLQIIDKHKAKSEEKNICSTCANANNVVVCPYTIKDIAAEEGCKFWHEPERSDKE